jgi:hypothetical protein
MDGREPPADALPTGSDLYDAYLKPLAETPEMAGVIETGAKVKAVTRLGADKVLSQGREQKPFVLAVSNGNGAIRRDLAQAVIDASGTWSSPNPLGAGGIMAEGEAENRTRLPMAFRTCSGVTATRMPARSSSWSAPVTRPRTCFWISQGLPSANHALRSYGQHAGPI